MLLSSFGQLSETKTEDENKKCRRYRRFFLTVYIHLAFPRVLYVVLLSHDDVLDVFHGEVIAEGVVQEPLQLFHR